MKRKIALAACGACLVVVFALGILLTVWRPAGPVAISFLRWTDVNAKTQALFVFTNCGAATYLCDGELEAAELRNDGLRSWCAFKCTLQGQAASTQSLAMPVGTKSWWAGTNGWRVSASIYASTPRPGWQHRLVSMLDRTGVHIYGGGENRRVRVGLSGSLGAGLDPDPIYAFTNSWVLR
jgi:hypothetical protein